MTPVIAVPRAPPPTRGWTGGPRDRLAHPAGSPAHAGMDRLGAAWPGVARRLPRPRGDGPLAWRAGPSTRRAPPPTRGWTCDMPALPDLPSGSPAHAGMDPDWPADADRARRLPRPRGDGPSRPPRSATDSTAPPPTRGWTVGGAVDDAAALGSPAHAGMDRTCGSAETWSTRLPRPRGDGPPVQIVSRGVA